MAAQVSEESAADYSASTLGELGEVVQGTSFAIGVCSGYERAAKLLRQKSGGFFAAGQDSQARTYREIAELMEAEAKRERAHFDTNCRERERAAFDELEKRDKAVAAPPH